MEQISKPDENDGESKAERRLRKEAERAAESSPLDPWERYRALNDLVDHMLDVIEMADRRTRFALLLLGSLNAANLLLVARGDMFGITLVNPTLVRLYVGCYLVLSLYFLMHAVNALKPRSRQMGLANEVVAAPGAVGLRLVDDILKQRSTTTTRSGVLLRQARSTAKWRCRSTSWPGRRRRNMRRCERSTAAS